MSRSHIAALFIALSIAASGCSSFSLREHQGVLPIEKQRRASDASLFVMPFPYEPDDPEDVADLTESDLLRWQHLVASGIDQSNIFETVKVAQQDEMPTASDYVLKGRITRFKFQKNWFPTYFPLHLALSFFTLTGYTVFGGPMTWTIVRFSAQFELQRAESDRVVAIFDESYQSTRAMNAYSNGAKNPFDNPNLVFAEVISSAATKIALALPPETEPQTAEHSM